MTEDDLVNALSLLHADEDVFKEMTPEELTASELQLWELEQHSARQRDRIRVERGVRRASVPEVST